MTLTLKNYIKHLGKELLQAAEKCKVRECDETEKGVFVAYVDEGNHSFDVSITVMPNGEIAKGSCDCQSTKGFCAHKVALLVHVAKGNNASKAPKISKKPTSIETLLDQTDFNSLKEWVKNLIDKNKDIELSFINRFSAKKEYYTPKEVTTLVNNALKASGCTKKSADASQVKKLVELLSETLNPIVQYYELNPTDDDAFESFHTLMERCLYLYATINSSSVRMLRYVEDLLKKTEPAINNLEVERSWLLAVNHFACHIAEPIGAIRLHYVNHIKNIIAAANESKREKIISGLAEQFQILSNKDKPNWVEYAQIIFGIIKSNSLLTKYYKIFKPLNFQNNFNVELIELLIDLKKLDLAAQYCKAQIATNFREDYNVPYLQLLKNVYTQQKDDAKLAYVLKELFPWTFSFDDYLFISSQMDDEERKKWRGRILARARNARHSNPAAAPFCFDLLAHENNYRKMFEYLDSDTPYSTILKHFEPLVASDKAKLLDAIIRKSDHTWPLHTNTTNDDDTSFRALFDLMVKYYKRDFLELLMKQLEKNPTRYYLPNRFINYMREKLLPQS